LPIKEKEHKPSVWLDNLCLAFSFLTIIPVPVKQKPKSAALAQAMIFFPLVGLCIGMVSLAVAGMVDSHFPPRLTALFLVLIPVILSGGLHIDGIADFFDAIFHTDRQEILRIMKDSRIGVWGTLGVVFVILFKWEALSTLLSRDIVFLLALSLSRWSFVMISFLLAYARPEGGLGKEVAGQVTPQHLAISTIGVVLLSLFLGWKGLAAVMLSASFVFLLSRWYRRKIGGVTGDVIGATGELTEVFVYLAILMMNG
jgi:adenosylcobinamide-GDP ribazoletransferase